MTKLLTLALAEMMAVMLLGCGMPNPIDTTPVKVRIVTVWTQADYNRTDKWSATYPRTVVERLDTGERVMIRYDTWGKTGDVFTIKECNLHW
jgi:hypothetical protein